MSRTIVHFTDSDAFGGTEQALLYTLAGLDRRRWQPVLFHHGDPGIQPLLKQAEDCNVRLRVVPRMLTFHDIGRMPRFVGAIRSERPAIFHAHLTWPLSCKYGLAAALLVRVPAVVATAQLYVEPPQIRSVHAQLRLIAAGVDRYLAVSKKVANHLCRGLGIPGRKVQVIHNGVPLLLGHRSTASRLRALLPGTTGRPIVLSTARLEEQKGLRYLVEAAAEIPEAVFVFAGEGSERGRLEAQALKLRVADRVVLLGYRNDIRDLLAGCDLFVLPSLNEGLPLAILEAMAAGKPVIATDVGGTAEVIVDGETGLLVPPADAKSLARAIRSLLADSGSARRLAAAAEARVRGFSADTMIQRIMRVYDELTQRLEVNPSLRDSGSRPVHP